MESRLIDARNLATALRAFSAERDWNQFHTPKILAIALAVEAAELLEVFQWLTQEESGAVSADPNQSDLVAQELADILVYLVRLADVLEIDLNRAVSDKLASNARKYPVDRAKGSAAKYTEYDR